jgi:hypothetical protein
MPRAGQRVALISVLAERTSPMPAGREGERMARPPHPARTAD